MKGGVLSVSLQHRSANPKPATTVSKAQLGLSLCCCLTDTCVYLCVYIYMYIYVYIYICIYIYMYIEASSLPGFRASGECLKLALIPSSRARWASIPQTNGHGSFPLSLKSTINILVSNLPDVARCGNMYQKLHWLTNMVLARSVLTLSLNRRVAESC